MGEHTQIPESHLQREIRSFSTQMTQMTQMTQIKPRGWGKYTIVLHCTIHSISESQMASRSKELEDDLLRKIDKGQVGFNSCLQGPYGTKRSTYFS